jgi:Tfp pilus assembly protein PilX
MKHPGFATPVALGFALLMALLAVSALQDAGISGSLATTRLLHQRAFAAGEIGLARVAAQLAVPGAPLPASRRASLPAHPTDSMETRVTEAMATELASGLSAGRVIQRHFEVQSIGRSARGTRVVVVEGLRRLEAVPEP